MCFTSSHLVQFLDCESFGLHHSELRTLFSTQGDWRVALYSFDSSHSSPRSSIPNSSCFLRRLNPNILYTLPLTSF